MKIKIMHKASFAQTVADEIKETSAKSRTGSGLKGKLFVFTGPSGAGKTTLAQAMLGEFDFFKKLITCTTRPMREGEVQNVDYHFISKEIFEEHIAKDELMEYDFHYGYYYGSLKKDVEEIMFSGKSVLVCVDVNGALTIKNKFAESVVLFVKTPSLSSLKKRLIMRGTDKMDVIDERMKKAKEELKIESKFDYVIVNDDLKVAIKETKKIILDSLK